VYCAVDASDSRRRRAMMVRVPERRSDGAAPLRGLVRLTDVPLEHLPPGPEPTIEGSEKTPLGGKSPRAGT